jgi:hypothetical protein
MIGRPGAVSPVIDALAERGFVQDADREQRQQYCLIGARIPYRVEHVQIPNAFDLRLIDCQQYVVEEFFKKDSAKLTKSDRSGIDSFVESLPVLMQPELGGGAMGGDEGAILQAFAAFLRLEGAQALVYPAALARDDAPSNVLTGVREAHATAATSEAEGSQTVTH